MDNIKKTICCATGKSGGHIIPNLTLAQQYAKKYDNARIMFFSNTTPLDFKLLAHKVDIHIPLSLTRLNNIIDYCKIPFLLAWCFIKSFFFLLKEKPELIISTGGIEAIPVCIMGWILHIPIHLYEVNALPGKALKLLAPLASQLYVCFESTQYYFKNAQQTSYPIRFESNTPIPISHFEKNRKTILVLGGSQGSRTINDAILKLVQDHTISQKIQIIHQYGFDTRNWKNIYNQHAIPAVTFAFIDTIENYYPLADMVICRAGAGSLFETAYFKKPCITIPLEKFAGGHQVTNAQAISKHNTLFTCLHENELSQLAKLIFQ
jgi:UDP-N-acetylglucosamine--N-acetylmuramyl-(pentapeptide) pyrophosphoryl-undecaprenol N-acetylglucosamine transferase